MFDLYQNYTVARKLAAEGMVLLKNEQHILPFSPESRLGIVGNECLDLISGGGGSAQVHCEYVKSLIDGIEEKVSEGKLCFYTDSIKVARQPNRYSVAPLNELAQYVDTAIVTLKRYGSEGEDRQIGRQADLIDSTNDYDGEANQTVIDNYENDVGYYYPSKRELDRFEALQASKIQNVVLILNISSIVDISFIEKFPKIKAVLLVYLPGMESGRAIADVLCGDVNPSGRLTDTIAYNYSDYPSATCFNYDPDVTEYKEGLYVGYRYFETFAKDRVLYPFGFGLSYTDFVYENMTLTAGQRKLTVHVDVRNSGNRNGREVVQIYSAAPTGKLQKPAVELRTFAKTRELKPNESETLHISFEINSMASFDATGETGNPAAWVLEAGEYHIYVGKNVRERYECGTYLQSQTTVTEQLTLRFSGERYSNSTAQSKFSPHTDKPLTLYDVAEGRTSMEELIGQLTPRELIHLAMGQPPAFPLGTAGIGNLKMHGIPNPQTADGPAGIRRSVHTTCFPCGTLIAASWDVELEYAMGKAMGVESYHTNVDILLAPSMNIHRNPLCGRNFEYYSEDPLLSGLTATAIVRGIQSEGVCATIKHFAANNCEYRRKYNNSVIDERTLREIYLKGFEIAVKQGKPAFVMTSYNKINGVHTSENPQLLRGVLRDEWGFEGATMTDWRNKSNLDNEILAGNNVKMPFGYPDQEQIAYESYQNGKLSIACLRENAEYVLRAVLKTRSFHHKEFGVAHPIKDKINKINAISVDQISSTRIRQAQREDGTWYLYSLGKDQRAQRTYVTYALDIAETREYKVSTEISTNCPRFEIYFFNEQNKLLGNMSCAKATDSTKWYPLECKLPLIKGTQIIKVVFADDPDHEYAFSDTFLPLPKEDIKFAGLTIE